MKMRCCLIVLMGLLCLRLSAAAVEYSPEDYTTFFVMQRIAHAHFALAENINQQLRIEARKEDALMRPGVYWFSDQRNTEPDPTQTVSLSQGLLFNPNTRTLYSRFGAWCFASEAMYTCAYCDGEPRIPKKDVWNRFRRALLKTYHIDLSERQDPHVEYVVRRYYGTILPTVIFEEPLFGPSYIEDHSGEGESAHAEQSMLPAPIVQPELPRASRRRIFDFFSRLIGRWRTSQSAVPRGNIGEELVSILDTVPATSVPEKPHIRPHVRYTRDQEKCLAMWREMKRRFDTEDVS